MNIESAHNKNKVGQGSRLATLALIATFYLVSGLSASAQTPAVAPAPTNPVQASTLTSAPTTAQAVVTPAPAGVPAPSDMAAASASSNVSQPLDQTVLLGIADAKRHVRDGSVMPDDTFPTLFFTAWQHALLLEAKIGFKTRLPEGALGSGADAPKKDPGIREVSLGGIAFANAGKWTVWLNGVRVTPNAIPEQVLDIKVSQGYIDLKWFDNYTNRIYPIRLRPQERFNLDSRIFLPGAGVGAM